MWLASDQSTFAYNQALEPMPSPQSYHHGDLRRALIEAALAIVAKEGVKGLSIRKLARHVGVSHAAPGHHFASKAAILDALAVEGYKALNTSMEDAVAGIETPIERLLAIGRGYVSFAAAHPAHFRLMFRESLGVENQSEELNRHGGRAFDALRDCCRDVLAERGDPKDLEALTLSAWSLVHGLSTLWIDGTLQRGGVAPEGEVSVLQDEVERLFGALLREGLQRKS